MTIDLNTDALEVTLGKIDKILCRSESDPLLMRDMLAEIRFLADVAVAAFDRRNFPTRAALAKKEG